MQVLLEILLETVILIAFLWVGKSIMKAQMYPKHLLIIALAGALASQVPFVGSYLSFGVVLFFMWKMARVDMVPDGVLIVIIGKGVALIAMIYGVAIFMDFDGNDEVPSFAEISVYENEDGVQYYAEGEKVYYRDEGGERVYVDATEIYGIGEMMELVNEEASVALVEPTTMDPPVPEEAVVLEEAEEEIVQVEKNFDTLISDSVIRGLELPFEVFVPRGWMVHRSPEKLEIGLDGDVYIQCYSRSEALDNKTYLRNEVNRILDEPSGLEILRQELVTIDGTQWARLQFADELGNQLVLLTHADRRGCYSIELSGSFDQLSENRDSLSRIMNSFNFPPTTYFLAQSEASE